MGQPVADGAGRILDRGSGFDAVASIGHLLPCRIDGRCVEADPLGAAGVGVDELQPRRPRPVGPRRTLPSPFARIVMVTFSFCRMWSAVGARHGAPARRIYRPSLRRRCSAWRSPAAACRRRCRGKAVRRRSAPLCDRAARRFLTSGPTEVSTMSRDSCQRCPEIRHCQPDLRSEAICSRVFGDGSWGVTKRRLVV